MHKRCSEKKLASSEQFIFRASHLAFILWNTGPKVRSYSSLYKLIETNKYWNFTTK